MNAIILIADIVKSKEIVDRNQFQSELKRELDAITSSSKDILSPYTITLGDEFQAVYKEGGGLLRDIFRILTRVYPVRIRFAVSMGDISTQVNEAASLGMDGPGFYAAREGMTHLKKLDYSVVQFYGDLLPEIELMNTSLRLCFSVISDWKENTLRIFNALLNDEPVRAIAPDLNISERGVYKTMNTHHLRNYVDYFHSVENRVRGED
jgi:hypothetical protein